MEDIPGVSSEEELVELREQGKMSEDEYSELHAAMSNRASAGAGPGEVHVDAARLSRVAVWGAFWPVFFFVALGLHFIGARPVVVRGEELVGPVGPAWWQYVLMFTIMPLGLTAPFGTTICGLVSISQIRHSAGRLYGLGLAVVDTAVFPLLLLLGLCYWFVTVVNKVCLSAGIYAHHNALNQKEVMLGIAFVIWAILGWLFVRWVWRASTRGSKPSSVR